MKNSNTRIYGVKLINEGAKVLATASDRLTYVGGNVLDRNGWLLAAHDTTLGGNPQNRLQVWLSEDGKADIYVGANVIDTMTKASRDYITANRTPYNANQGYRRESKLTFRGDDALERAFDFLESIQYKKSTAKKDVENVA